LLRMWFTIGAKMMVGLRVDGAVSPPAEWDVK
jgi:hypothetical protein